MKQPLLIATKNRNKAKEMQAILLNFPLQIRTLSDMKDIVAPDETGHTFRENALIKVHYYYSEFKIPVIAEDSGLVVPALGGEPGVKSARYAGSGHNYKENNKKLLEKLSGFEPEKRFAYFVCYAVYFDGSDSIESEGRVEGMIIEKERGQNGFGYDPVFLYPQINKTFAEMDAEEKNRISHRKIAFSILGEKLKSRFQSLKRNT